MGYNAPIDIEKYHNYMTRKILLPAGLVLYCLFILLPFTNKETIITMKGEYRWTLPTIVETYVSKDWLIPKLDGAPRFRKPPLGYWAMVGACKLFTLNLFW